MAFAETTFDIYIHCWDWVVVVLVTDGACVVDVDGGCVVPAIVVVVVVACKIEASHVDPKYGKYKLYLPYQLLDVNEYGMRCEPSLIWEAGLFCG